MKQANADDIREHVIKRHIEPARKRGAKRIKIRAGDIHREMGLKDRMPAVCGALGTQIFLDDAGVSLIDREGPSQGANVFFTFSLYH